MKRDKKLINSFKISFDSIKELLLKYEVFHVEEKLRKLSQNVEEKAKKERERERENHCFEAREIGQTMLEVLEIIGQDNIKIGLKVLVWAKMK